METLEEKISFVFALALERAAQVTDVHQKKQLCALILNTESELLEKSKEEIKEEKKK